MHRTPPQKRDQCIYPRTPVCLPSDQRVILRPDSVDSMDNPHSAGDQPAPSRLSSPENSLRSILSMPREERGEIDRPRSVSHSSPHRLPLQVSVPGLRNNKTNSPPVNWTIARRDSSLPLRNYPTYTLQSHHSSAPFNRSTLTTTPSPLPLLTDMSDPDLTHTTVTEAQARKQLESQHLKGNRELRQGADNMSAEEAHREIRSHEHISPIKPNKGKSREASGSSDASDEHVFTLKGLMRELRKIWPQDLPRDIEEVKRGLENAIKEGYVGPSVVSTNIHGGENGERSIDGRHRRVQTVDNNSSVRLRHPSPVKNLRERFQTGKDEDSPPARPPSPPASPASSTHRPSNSVPQVPHPRHAVPPGYMPHPLFATPPIVLPSFHPGTVFVTAAPGHTAIPANTAPTDAHDSSNSHDAYRRPRSQSRRESKAVHYFEGLYDHMQHQDSVRHTQDRVIGELSRANEHLRTATTQLQAEVAHTAGNVAYISGVVQTLVNENHQLKLQLQGLGHGYGVNMPPPGPVRPPRDAMRAPPATRAESSSGRRAQ